MKKIFLLLKNMVYSTSDHKRKHFHTLVQNKNKEMETRLPMSALQKFATCWFCIKLNFISLVNTPCKEAHSDVYVYIYKLLMFFFLKLINLYLYRYYIFVS